jgi:DNA-binding Lrp family transcriptional regulator
MFKNMTKKPWKPDEMDKVILKELVRNSNRSYRELARDVGIAPATIIERVKTLEQAGIIIGYGARFNYLELGFEFMAIVEINISAKNLLLVEGKIARIPHVAAVWDMTGGYDALAVVMCKSRAELSATVKKILSIEGVTKTNTNIVLNVVSRLTEFEGV